MGFDLIEKRQQRSGFIEAARGASTYEITAGDDHIASLPPELPLSVLAPFRSLTSEAIFLASEVFGQMQDGKKGEDIIPGVLRFLVGYPDLPDKILAVLREAAVNLLGEEGYDRLMGYNLSGPDVIDLIRDVVDWFGVEVGEASGSSDSSTDSGTTSTTTSAVTSGSTSATPSETSETPDSSTSAA